MPPSRSALSALARSLLPVITMTLARASAASNSRSSSRPSSAVSVWGGRPRSTVMTAGLLATTCFIAWTRFFAKRTEYSSWSAKRYCVQRASSSSTISRTGLSTSASSYPERPVDRTGHSRRRRVHERQLDPTSGSFVPSAGDRHRSPVLLNDLPGFIEADAPATRLGRSERNEERFAQILLGHTFPGVADLGDGPVVFRVRADGDGAVPADGIHGIRDQVLECPLQRVGVGLHHHRFQ